MLIYTRGYSIKPNSNTIPIWGPPWVNSLGNRHDGHGTGAPRVGKVWGFPSDKMENHG